MSRYSQKLSEKSAEELAKEIDRLDRCYDLPVAHRAWLSLRWDGQLEKCERFERFDELAQACGEWAKE